MTGKTVYSDRHLHFIARLERRGAIGRALADWLILKLSDGELRRLEEIRRKP